MIDYRAVNVESVNSISVSAPTISYRYCALKIAKIVEDGDRGKQGDTIIFSILQRSRELSLSLNSSLK